MFYAFGNVSSANCEGSESVKYLGLRGLHVIDNRKWSWPLFSGKDVVALLKIRCYRSLGQGRNH